MLAIIRAIPILLLFAALSANAQSVDFPTAVVEILNSQTDGPIAEMSPDKREAMIDCVVNTLQALPAGKKRQISEGATFEDREHRFGIVVDENHAQWRKRIANSCAHIALGEGGLSEEAVEEASE
jgi:hypothetical protein